MRAHRLEGATWVCGGTRACARRAPALWQNVPVWRTPDAGVKADAAAQAASAGAASARAMKVVAALLDGEPVDQYQC